MSSRINIPPAWLIEHDQVLLERVIELLCKHKWGPQPTIAERIRALVEKGKS